MKHAMPLWYGLIAAGLVLSGCTLSRPRPEVRYYALALNLPEQSSELAKASLIVRHFSARDPYNQERMIYRASPYLLDFYHSHRWAAPPAEMVTDWTRRYLRGTGAFARVFPTTDGSGDFVLGGVIRQFEEVDKKQTWEATLGIDFWLARGDQRSPFWFQTYSATQETDKRNPEAVAEAMSRNLEDILQQLAADLQSVLTTPPLP